MKLGILATIFLCASFLTLGAQTPSAPKTAASAAAQPTPAPAAAPLLSAMGDGPIQPIPFSHPVHAGDLKMPCQYCHSMKKSGATLRIPQAKDCMACHATIATENPGVKTLAQYAKSGKLIPWVRVYQLPSFVHFSHKQHLTHGVTCHVCHGDVTHQTRIFQATDISMGGCVQCHEARKAPVSCDTCHGIDD